MTTHAVYLFLVSALALYDGLLIEGAPMRTPPANRSTRHEAANVSFSVGSDGYLDMRVHLRSQTFDCPHLYDDMNDVMEERSENGSLILVRGSQGVLLQSSSDSVECRLRIRNQAGGAYTIHDVPSTPGVFSAYLVPYNGEPVEIEKQGEDGFIARMPEQHAFGHRRRLQGYYEFSCKFPKVRYVKIGVIVDDKFVKDAGGVQPAKELVRKHFKDASVPYEHQFNIRLLPFHILVPSDTDCSECAFVSCQKKLSITHLKTLEAFRRKTALGKRDAAWHVISGCADGGVAVGNNMGETSAVGVTASPKFVAHTIAHEVGHNFGMRHSFDHEGQKKGAGDGIMDYTSGAKTGYWYSSPGGNNLHQFHKVHDEEACKVLARMNDKENKKLVPWEERWSDVSSESDPPDSPGNPTAPPSNPTLPPSTPTAPPGNSTPKPTDSSSSSLSLWVILICIAAVLVLSGFAFWYFSRSVPSPPTKSKPEINKTTPIARSRRSSKSSRSRYHNSAGRINQRKRSHR